MSNYLLIALAMLPGSLVQRGPRVYYGGTLALQAVSLAAGIVWLLTPLGLWQAYGHWWMLLWLVPTACTVFAVGFMPPPGAG